MAGGDLKVSREERGKKNKKGGKKWSKARVMNTKRYRGRKEDERGRKVILKKVKEAVVSAVR